MKALLRTFLCLALSLAADEPRTSLVKPGKLVAQPDLKEPLGAGWMVKHGTWEVKAGEVVIAEVAGDKHVVVLWHEVGLPSAIVQCEFQFEGGRTFILGCDATNKHVGRLVITAKSAKLVEDSSEVKGKQPGQTLEAAVISLQPGQWYAARFECRVIGWPRRWTSTRCWGSRRRWCRRRPAASWPSAEPRCTCGTSKCGKGSECCAVGRTSSSQHSRIAAASSFGNARPCGLNT